VTIPNENHENSAYVRKFAFRPFSGKRRGRIYRIWAASWHWWISEWKRSRAVKVLFGFLIFSFVVTNLFLLATKDIMFLNDPSLTPNGLLETTIKDLVRSIVSFQGSFHMGSSDNGSGMLIGGLSIFVLIMVVLIGSGLISDDLSNQTIEVYYSKLEKHEYILAKIGAFLLAGTTLITLPFVIEFILLVVGLGNVDIIQAIPVLIFVIAFTQLIVITYGIVLLAFSSLSKRRLYTGLSTFMIFFLISMIIPSLAIENGEVGFPILFDILSLLIMISYLWEGITSIQFSNYRDVFILDLQNGLGVEAWMIYATLGSILLVGLAIITIQVYWRHNK
jgi:ABC-type transport system involved in multi-copper enzyme maturation permease subunit